MTDHYSLKSLFNIKNPSGRIAQWVLRLQQYDFKVVHRPGKNHLVADILSRYVPIISAIKGSEEEAEQCNDKRYNDMCKVSGKSQEYPV